MANNAWRNREECDLFMDRSRNARFTFYQYAVAFRQVQNWIFDAFKKEENEVRDNLYTLIKYSNPTITTIGVPSLTDDLTINHIDYPTDYRYFSTLVNRVDGNFIETKDNLNYNQLSNVLSDPFLKPSNERAYLLEDNTGWRIYRGYGGVLTNELTYLINPSDWSIGTESDLINASISSVLTLGVNYTATANCVVAGVKYEPSQQFNATTTILTSGQVIPTSVLVNSNLPDSLQSQICRYVSWLLQGVVSSFDKAKFSQEVAVLDGK